MLRTFVLSQVVPNIRCHVPKLCALVLGKAFLWFLHSDDIISDNFFPKEFKNRNWC